MVGDQMKGKDEGLILFRVKLQITSHSVQVVSS